MNKSNQFLLSLATFAVFFGLVVSGNAQQTAPDPQSPSQPSAQEPAPPAPQPDQPSQTAPQPAPDSQAQAQPQPTDSQLFTGTVVKAGEKYVLQVSGGNTYDIDHQDLVQKYEGKQVRVKGTLDPDGKTIHIIE